MGERMNHALSTISLSPNAKRWLSLATPGFVLWLAFWWSPALPMPFSVRALFFLLPYVLFTAAIALGWFFQRRRVVYMGAGLILVYWLLDYTHLGGFPRQVALAATSVLLPLNLIFICLQKEQRSILSLRTLTLASIVLLQIEVVARLYETYSFQLLQFLTVHTIGGIDVSSWTSLSIPALITSFVGLFVLAIQFVRKPKFIEAGFFWTLAGAVFALNTGLHNPQYTVFMSVTGLLLTLALLKTWYDIAYLDELTGLPGRLALNELSKTLRGTYVIAMVDVDHFKKFNDTYGHDVGDQVLRLVASKLMNVTGGGKPFRYGGEEFAVIFPGRHIKEAFPHLAALREVIEDTHMVLRNKLRPDKKPELPRKRPARNISVTVSIGIAECDHDHEAPEQVFKASDEALYRAKERGRNRRSM